MNQEEGPHQNGTDYHGALILDFLVCRTMKNKFLLLVSHLVHGILLQQSEQTKDTLNFNCKTGIVQYYSMGIILLSIKGDVLLSYLHNITFFVHLTICKYG